MTCQACYGCHERCNACGAGSGGPPPPPPLAPTEAAKARRLAEDLHSGQTDKAGRPYREHLHRVAGRLPEGLRAAGYLHDAIEDTPVTAEDLRALGYSARTVGAVEAVTRRAGETYAAFIERVAGSGVSAVLVKLADVRDHLETHPEAIPESLRQRYLRALVRLLRALLDTPPAEYPEAA